LYHGKPVGGTGDTLISIGAEALILILTACEFPITSLSALKRSAVIVRFPSSILSRVASNIPSVLEIASY
jgi:hypothetical protein